MAKLWTIAIHRHDQNMQPAIAKIDNSETLQLSDDWWIHSGPPGFADNCG